MIRKVRGYFLVKNTLVDNKTGISQKIYSQINAMNQNGLECKLLKQYNHKSLLSEKLEKYIPFANINPTWGEIDHLENVEFLYFRHPRIIYSSMLKFLEKYKMENPALKIFMEIPTFPYDFEYVGIRNQYLILIDKYYRKHLTGLVDCIFISDSSQKQLDKLWDVDCVRFLNGYDVQNSTVPQHIVHSDYTINLTCVAMFSFWHGYERLLYGLRNYLNQSCRKYKFIINFVGDGPELENYRRIVTENGLENFTLFHGKKFGADLDNIYANTDIGISCLGCYKKNIDIIGDLKTREYLAKGIPTFAAYRVDLFADGIDTDFYREIPNDDTPVDMNEIINFYEFIEKKRENEKIESLLYNYSLKKFDYNITILPITNKIEELLLN